MVPLPTPHSPRFFIDHVAPEAALPRLEAVSLSCSRHDRETRMRDLTRRQLLQHLGLITAGLAGACTPLKVLTSAYPQAFDHDAGLTAGVLRAFALTVIPSAPAGDPDLPRAFPDPDLPFAPYAGFFASDLARRAGERSHKPLSPARGAP